MIITTKTLFAGGSEEIVLCVEQMRSSDLSEGEKLNIKPIFLCGGNPYEALQLYIINDNNYKELVCWGQRGDCVMC